MATRQIVQVVDDLDGATLEEGEARRITFSIEGRSYELDLSEKNADKFYAVLAPYVDAARSVRTPSLSNSPSRSRASSNLDLNAVRVWARSNGHTVSDRGRVAASVVNAYNAANG